MRTIVLYIYVVAISISNSLAQTIDFQFVESSSTAVQVDSTYDEYGNLELATSVAKGLSCQVSDTSGIASIRVTLGTEESGSDILNHSFNFSGEVASAFLSFSRTGIMCQFALGQFVNRDFAYLRLEALSSTGAVLGFYSGMLN
jgi:hypothetical protein